MMEKGRFIQPNTIRVCIDEEANNIVCGRAYCKMKKEPIVFPSVEYLLLEADKMFDQSGFPQAFQVKRSFREEEVKYTGYNAKPSIYFQDKELMSKCGRLKTIEIFVNTRRNSSWQGMVFDEDGKCLGDFNGDMELIPFFSNGKRMNSAIPGWSKPQKEGRDRCVT